MWKKKAKNIKANGESNMISLANWPESRVALRRWCKSAPKVVYSTPASHHIGNGLYMAKFYGTRGRVKYWSKQGGKCLCEEAKKGWLSSFLGILGSE